MKSESIAKLKKELVQLDQTELLNLTLRLARFKKENKELLTYLLFESENEEEYIDKIKASVEIEFNQINTSSYYFIRKSVRKILRILKKYIRYSNRKETEIELLLFFCAHLKEIRPSYTQNKTLVNTYQRQLELIKKGIAMLHEDLQMDYQSTLEALEE